jgi:toxin-antitoxin system PIN domain toxin
VILLDVNVLIYAHRAELPQHAAGLAFLNGLLDGDDGFAASSVILSSFLRITTHHRVFDPPTPMNAALAFVAVLQAHPAYVALEPGDRHWKILEQLCRLPGIRGPLVTDAWIAALAIEHGCELATSDGDFRRFSPRLRLLDYV